MSTTDFTKIFALLLLCHCTALAQVSSTAPKHWKSGSPVGLDVSFFGQDHQLLETVRREILDTNTLRLMAQSVQLSQHEEQLFQVAPAPSGEDLWFYRLGDEWSDGCDGFAQRLISYINERRGGHSRACLLAGLTNRAALSTISDPDLLILSTNCSILPLSWFRKGETGTTTNKAGQVSYRSMTLTFVKGNMQLHTNDTRIPHVDEVCRWVSFDLVDGDIAWRFVLSFKSDGAVDRIDSTERDAKELDPAFQSVIKEVDSEVTTEMKRNGTFGKFGSVRTYWRLKKEKLKTRGIDWHSPGELNKGTIYD